MPFFCLLAFIIINFLILFLVRSRVTTISALIIAHLVVILFLSISITNYNSFKEITLALMVYSMVILFLISNFEKLGSDDKVKPEKDWRRVVFFNIVVFLFVLSVFFAVFFIAKNIVKISETVSEKKFSQQNEVMANPMLLPSHEVHNAVKKFYLGKKISEDWVEKNSSNIENNDKKIARLKDKLSDNFLLKRSSDVILLIVAVTTILLLLARKQNSKNNSLKNGNL